MMTTKELLQVTGAGNSIDIADADSLRATGSSIQVTGSHNRIQIGRDVVFNGFVIQVSSNHNTIVISDRTRMTGKVIMKLTDGNGLDIGAGTSVGGCNFICGEGTTIRVGEDCMISWGVEIRTTDSHAIFACDTGARINPPSDIEIGSHVWIGAQATVLKGTRIGGHSVVGIRSVLSGCFDENNVILAGVPAKVVRRGVDWDRRLLG